ncbi:extracellular solute-binding protein [Paludifilum halophilum]|uniref:Maltodextrin-binding protein n=1 Tax=Paludifilum halophilum TaxID=1642702 RepID=A0A235B4B9_9BACL|nr:extracellular solute-binding protein [Paludifilum halophilum]OYD06465.1 hypothetical protein CHM34_16365 [Paludifilum halophilum]
MKWRIWGSIAMIFLLTVGVLAGCGPQRDADPDKKEAGKEEKPEQLVIWENKEARHLKHTERMAEKYEEKTGIQVKVVGVDILKQQEKLTLDGPNNKGADVVTWPHDRIGEAAIKGLIQPIDVEEDRIHAYNKSALRAMQYDGKLYGLPRNTESIALIYNKDRMKEPPKTFEELIRFAEENTDPAKEKYGFLYEGENFYHDFFVFHAFGGYVFKDEGGRMNTEDIGLNNEGSIQAMETIGSWYKDQLIPRGLKADTVNGLFKEGKVAAVLNGPWAVKDYEDAGIDVGVSPIPPINGKDPKTFIGVKGLYVSAYTRNEYWATDLVRFLTGKEALQDRFKTTGEIPSRTDLLEHPIVKDDEQVNGFAEQAASGVPMPNVPEMSQVWDPMADAVSFVAKGEQTPKEALDGAVKQIKEKLQTQKQ